MDRLPKYRFSLMSAAVADHLCREENSGILEVLFVLD